MSKYSPEFMTRYADNKLSIGQIKRAIDNSTILEAKVNRCNKNNSLIMEISNNITCVIELSELEYNVDKSKETKDISAKTKVNRHVKFIPTSIEIKDDKYIVNCSRKLAQKQCQENFIEKLLPGDVIDAKIVRVVNYGVFCDIGCGIVALLPTNNISVTHVTDIKKMMYGISRLKVIVHNIDDIGRVVLSHRELLGTWEEEASKFSVNDTVHGVVLNTEEYGTFIRISQNLCGLADNTISDLKTGDDVIVKILSIKDINMKIRLVVISKDENLEKQTQAFKYTKVDGHISKWVYSTKGSNKVIETVFDK